MEKVLTVSIAAYNCDNYIEGALNSLLDEAIVDDIEILVCDDGGKDRTLDIVRDYEKKFPNTVKAVHKENGGYGSVINTNARLATGKYFKQLDGDDWFDTKNLIKFIELLKNIDDDYVITPYIEFDEVSKQIKVEDRFSSFEGSIDVDEVDVKDFLSMHSTTIKTSILHEIDISITEHCFYTDVEFILLPLPYIKTLYFNHMPIYVYRIGREGQSVSPEGVKKHYQEHETVFWNTVSIYNKVKNISENRKKFIMYRLRKEVAVQLKYYCILPYSSSVFKEMRSFYQKLEKEYPEILSEAVQYSRFVKVFSKTKCYIYPLGHLVV